MKNLRYYGKSPYEIAVIHGGPGAPGDMAPVARELSSQWGILEPLQTQESLEGQVEELTNLIERSCDHPIILIGHSWGAFLSFILTAREPQLVKKLIMIGSGPYETIYAKNITQKRLNRLNLNDKKTLISLRRKLDNPNIKDKQTLFAEAGLLITKADTYNLIDYDSEVIEFQYEVNQKVWEEASLLRASGKLLELGKTIKCPVVAIHGDYDPHPAEGVEKPLKKIIQNFSFVLLEKCGHTPWYERDAKEEFYKVLKDVILNS